MAVFQNPGYWLGHETWSREIAGSRMAHFRADLLIKTYGFLG